MDCCDNRRRSNNVAVSGLRFRMVAALIFGCLFELGAVLLNQPGELLQDMHPSHSFDSLDQAGIIFPQGIK